jgi:hypothetical protein
MCAHRNRSLVYPEAFAPARGCSATRFNALALSYLRFPWPRSAPRWPRWVHGFIDGSCCALRGCFRFVDGAARFAVFVARGAKHICKHGIKLRGVPRSTMPCFASYVVPDFRVLIWSQGKSAKSVLGIGIGHGSALGVGAIWRPGQFQPEDVNLRSVHRPAFRTSISRRTPTYRRSIEVCSGSRSGVVWALTPTKSSALCEPQCA